MQIASEIEQYKENGFCVIKGGIPEEKLLVVLEEIDAIYAEQIKFLGLDVVKFEGSETISQNMRNLFDADTERYLAATRHAAKLASLQHLTSNKDVLRIVSEFGIKYPTIPSSPVLHVSSDELVIPDGYHGIPPHQDWPSIQGGLGTVIVWIPFMDVSKNQFPLEVIPGSHKKGIWDGKIEDHSFTINPNLYSDDDFVRNDMKLGDVLVASVFTVHRTGIKNSKGLRISSSTRYENSTEETFIERKYPCAYSRIVNREFITPDFPNEKQVKKIFE